VTEAPRPSAGIGGVRNVAVSAVLGGGGVVMLSELAQQSPKLAVAAVIAGAALFAFLPRPIDLRSAVYAFFVPIAMSYGAATGQIALLVIGGAVGVFFLLEKTAARRQSVKRT
jgi:hypothetical protein